MIPKIISNKTIHVAVIALIIVAVGALLLVKLFTSTQIVPTAIKNQLSIAVLYPSDSTFTIDGSSWKYDANLKLLSYMVKYNKSVVITVSEQASPPQFTEVPGVFDSLTNKLNTYSDFDTLNGHVYLTHPTELKGSQSALMNAKGVLMFAKPSKNLTDDNWRKFFNSLSVTN